MDSFTISRLVGSSQYRAVADDALKDEDNAAWVMALEPDCQKLWIERIGWIRLVDRLAENELVDPDSFEFRRFYSSWNRLLQGERIDSRYPHAEVLSQIHDRSFTVTTDQGAIVPWTDSWNRYLIALVRYHRHGLVIDTLEQYETMLRNLAGAFFQILPCLPQQYWQSVCQFGVLDQFYNNLRDMREDAEQGICYIPSAILARFGISRNQILQLTACDHPNYRPMMEFWLSQIPRLYQKTDQLITASDLPVCWQILREWSIYRYRRIEHIFRQCDYDYVRFSQAYWPQVQEDLPLLMEQLRSRNGGRPCPCTSKHHSNKKSELLIKL